METYSISSDFGGVIPDISILQNQINNNISQDLEGINVEGGNVNIIFNSSLSVSNKNILDDIVNKFEIRHLSLPLISMTITNTSYQRISLISLPIIKYIRPRIISYMDPACTSYDVRFLDKSNNNILLDVNLTNTTDASQILSSLSSLPSGDFDLEVLVKKKGGISTSEITVNSILLEYKC